MSQATHSYGVRDTSLDAFVKLKNYLGERQIEVYKAIIDHPHFTREEISNTTGIRINVVTGRVTELMKLGLVIEGEQREFVKGDFKTKQYELMAVRHIDWKLLDFKKMKKKEYTKIDKSHLYTISYLINFMEKNAGMSIRELMKIGEIDVVKPILDLQNDLEEQLDKIVDETPFFYMDNGYSLKWKSKSENTEEFYTIEYIKTSGKIACTCKDFRFRHRKCKHIKKLSRKLNKLGKHMELNEERFIRTGNQK